MRRRVLVFCALACGAASVACATVTPLPDGPLMDVTWQLVEVNGQPAGNGASGFPATLRLGSDGRAGGYAGCNRYGGGYAMDGTAMHFSDLAMTRMYCEGFMDLESAFSRALESTRRWNVADSHLELLENGRVLARFTRQAE